ncbi:uncharacterized protein PG986_011149 [Apiospora aurea]|uniref:Uncharacterized protein n=1 Tax=Apiospora aurea TaxID=335848 RepID=A0ABR1Q491_9PEZI
MAAPVTEAPTTTANGLPTQVTPFSFNAPGDPCQQSVYCPYISYRNYLSSPNLFHSEKCVGVQTGEPGFVEPSNEGDRSTLAYPSTACLAGWTTACTTTLTHQGSPYSQAWCCPSGSWSCATETGVSDRAAPQRLCQSPLSQSTTIWMTWDPPYSNNGSDIYTWTATVTSEEPQNAATVFHKVFPLQLTTGVETTTGGQGSPSETAGNAESDNSGGNLSQGAIAGISVGSALAVLFILFGMFLLYRRRKKRAPEPESAALQQPQPPQDHWEGKPELDGSAAAPRPDEVPKMELDAVDAARASTALTASISELGGLSPRSDGAGDGGFPSPDSRHNHVFEMQG